MRIDKDRIQNYLQDIKSCVNEIENLIIQYSDSEILSQPWLLRGLKYLLIEISEIMANTLMHILAKDKGKSVSGYIETIVKAGETGVLPKDLAERLKPIFDFRNSLVHRYWTISDESLLSFVRENYKSFLNFIEEVERYIKNSQRRKR
ncbi:MAG: DUF86 domain-containing protein [candidate division WOR-3 bacterium]